MQCGLLGAGLRGHLASGPSQSQTAQRHYNACPGISSCISSRCLSLAGLQGQVDSDWVADNGVFFLGDLLNDLPTALAYPSKTFTKIVDA